MLKALPAHCQDHAICANISQADTARHWSSTAADIASEIDPCPNICYRCVVWAPLGSAIRCYVCQSRSCHVVHACRMKDYHLESLSSFQAYKQFYTEQVVPVLTEHKSTEAALTEAEPRAATDAEVCFPVLSKMHVGCLHVCSLSVPFCYPFLFSNHDHAL